MEEVMDKRRKERMIKGIILNATVIIGCIVYIFMYLAPEYDVMWATLIKINDTRTNIISLKNDGVDANSFTSILTRLGRKKEVSNVIFADTEKLSKVLKKPSTVKTDYLTWLTTEIAKVNILDKEIQENNAILWNIIPIFVNSSTTTIDTEVENQMTLSSFISYIEKDILGKYTLTSYIPLGISNIDFPDKKDTPINIGNFKLTLDFTGKNSNILLLIDALQKSG